MYISLKDRFRSSVKYYRFKNKLSQEQLGEIVDLTPKYISDIERGKTTPSFDTVDRISEAFKVDPLDMLTDKYYEEYINSKRKIDEVRKRISRK